MWLFRLVSCFTNRYKLSWLTFDVLKWNFTLSKSLYEPYTRAAVGLRYFGSKSTRNLGNLTIEKVSDFFASSMLTHKLRPETCSLKTEMRWYTITRLLRQNNWIKPLVRAFFLTIPCAKFHKKLMSISQKPRITPKHRFSCCSCLKTVNVMLRQYFLGIWKQWLGVKVEIFLVSCSLFEV